ncbi:DUF7714 family protein [Nocardioides pocheonensis]|uniref:Uncharacterized protein n=1 Tax=Nocardioides pocheonensis TaxID=661485 RepID=A0A3N0GIB8_9ACTN|nr:hypothetical protein [Nocardioides pocheonensis]RNM12213.1 hypothetical protein EFL26_20655 [Nocardioides pocheonensis]
MIPEPPLNFITRPYRGLSVQEVDVELTEPSLLDLLVGREVYRRTDFLLLHRGDNWALAAVVKESAVPLFSPVVEARVLALPHQVRMLHSPDTDVGNASALARVAASNKQEGVLAYAVRGRFEHINVIWRPDPLVVRVTEVVPPWPAKLLAMAQQVLDFDEDLPPIALELDEVDITDLAAQHRADNYLLPCRGSGAEVSGQVDFLDTRPPARLDWLMVGCERSVQFHEHFYGDRAPRVDICPRLRPATSDSSDFTLTKCCLIERGIATDDARAIVPWGSNLDEVRLALRALVGLEQPPAPQKVQTPPWSTAADKGTTEVHA